MLNGGSSDAEVSKKYREHFMNQKPKGSNDISNNQGVVVSFLQK